MTTKMKSIYFKTGIIAAFILFDFNASCFAQQVSKRNTISLNGIWHIAEGKKDVIPDSFTHTVPVPGLVSSSIPNFKDVAPKVADKKAPTQTDPLREAFWYKRKFKIEGKIPSIAVLKICKAMYGTKVILNGKELGEHLPNFTPGYFDAKNALKTGVNDLIVRVGSSRSAVPLSIPTGFDLEKKRYIPGIFDNVLDEWGENIKGGKFHNFKILSINDTEEGWSGSVHLQILKDELITAEKIIPLTIPAYGQNGASISCEMPKGKGLYTIQAILIKNRNKPIKSVREIVIN